MAGRGVDILLGGNPEGLAKRDIAAEGLDTDTAEGAAAYAKLLEKHDAECRAEGDEVRKVGGVYVLGTERHESRRIDNQLRGRSGRQGDPGESRFYLSLEDELMRLFATGAMAWVMQKAFPDDVPLESKMVTKSVEKAQNTVEARNAEIRKNVLKYDEVMNEQRKVVYALRNQILEGQDLRDKALEELAEAVESVIGAHCVSDYAEEWDLDGLAADIRTYWPSQVTEEQLAECSSTDELYDLLMAEAVAHYEQREQRARRADHARGRAPGDAAHRRPEVARAPRGDGLPPRGHQPPGHGPARPADRVAARGLLDVRGDDEGRRPRLRALRDAGAGERAGAGPRPARSLAQTTPAPRRRTATPATAETAPSAPEPELAAGAVRRPTRTDRAGPVVLRARRLRGRWRAVAVGGGDGSGRGGRSPRRRQTQRRRTCPS